ncbi:threonine--tRNA ligase [Gammaproteobacteria bacterium]|nr:threonine--tRNA ligase [Gammaproteobacteria bacterium]
MPTITLPDGSQRQYDAAVTPYEVARSIGEGLARAARGATVDGTLCDLLTPIGHDAELSLLTDRDAETTIDLARHTLAHVLAQAVIELMVADGHPRSSVAMGVGPVIESGFYYDFDLPRPLREDELEALEVRMKAIIKKKLPLERIEVSREDALQRFADDPYKIELITDLPDGEIITCYRQGDDQSGFTDLCRGPHLPNTGNLPKFFKLTSLAGAYWRGDEKRQQLQRVYGIAFASKEALDHWLWQREEAKRRDHRKLGKELDIFAFDEEVGPGLPLWLPRGTIMIDELETLAKETERRAGYEHVKTPHLSKEDLFLTSGHLPYYAEDMFPPMELDGTRYFMKPMNCPFHHKIFAARPRSYRDLPLRFSEYGCCYRYEDSGALMGLMRVRSLQMNDAHIYCTEAQFEDEFMAVIDLYHYYFKLFGIDQYEMRLSKHSKEGLGKKYVDNESLWIKTEEMVRNAMTRGKINFVEVEDEAAFYGPKIDVQITSAIGREFTLATNQVDFAVPERFGLSYIDENNEKVTPLCLHRAPLSTHERMIGFLLEHFAGDLPLWLSPEQVRIVPISDKHHDYARTLERQFADVGIRTEVDDSSERMNYKVRQAELFKVPYIVVVGDKEAADNALSFRSRKEDAKNGVAVDAFVAHLTRHIKERSLRIADLES